MKRNVMIIFAAAAALLPLPARAQGEEITFDTLWTGFHDVHHRDSCRLAHQVLTSGQPANKRDWALTLISTCGPEGGDALARQLQAHRADVSETPALAELVSAARDFVDGALFREALNVAGDDGAGTAARVDAIRIIYGIIRPGTRASYRAFVDSPATFGGAFTTVPRYGAPLPANASAEARNVMRRITGGPNVDELRNAASRLLIIVSTTPS